MISLQAAPFINAQLAACILLAIYLATAAILLPREIQFLRNVEPPARNKFIFLDILIQLCILTVLLPNIMARKLGLELLILVVTGFTVLWAVTAINVWQRYIYTYKMLSKTIEEQKATLQKLGEQLDGEADSDG